MGFERVERNEEEISESDHAFEQNEGSGGGNRNKKKFNGERE